MVTACQTCGGMGFPVALIYCDNCQAYAVHRYCLDKLPVTFEEHVVWFCVDCEPKVVESSTLRKALPATSFQSRLKKGSPVRKSKGNNDINRLKNKNRKYDSDSLAISKVQRKSSPLLQPPENLEKDKTLRRSLRAHGPGSDKEVRCIEAKSLPNTCTPSKRSCWVSINEETESVNNRTSIVAINGHSNIIEHTNFLDTEWRELDVVYFDEVAGCVKTKASLGATSNQILKHNYVPVQPILEPIWRGSFHLFDENFATAVVAHLSSLACLKVCETAKCLPESLCLELLPRCYVWPKGFKKCGPSEESIALYFFPNNARDKNIFDGLVYKMIGRDLGMKAVVQDVELLVFTSKTLPLRFWRFQEKFYLWGVFRANQASHSTNVVNGEEKNLMKSLTWDSLGPVSPLGDTDNSLSG